jgi:hypothetical protein
MKTELAGSLRRKDYEAPQVTVHGDVAELTLVVGGTTGKNDGGAGKDKSQP